MTSARELVDGLVRMVGHRDPHTGFHLDAVGALSRRLAEQLGYDEAFVERVELAGRLHDVGKHTVPLGILLKPAPLDAEEWSEIRRHPEYGATIVACFPPLQPLVEIVRLHHERVDGNGYPQRRIGSEIPIESRIIAVADAFHAMTVVRPYAAARTPGSALGELIRCADTQFDGECVEAFIATFGGRAVVSAADLAGARALGRRSTA
jgi:HD-GYP domain-containing protein (c-di-GMP phosphodiesterase class II)